MKSSLMLVLTVCFVQSGYTQDYPIYKAPQALSCAHLSDNEISDCTNSLISQELFRAIEITVCHNMDSASHYELVLDVDKSGKVINGLVQSWRDKDSQCLEYLNKKAMDIVNKIQFSPALGKNGNPLTSKKYYGFSYPLHHIADSLMDPDYPYKVLEEMPRFTGCEHIIGNADDRKRCSDRQLLLFLYSNLKYPNKARENGTQGYVIAEFVVERNGMLDSINIVRDIGNGCGKAVTSTLKHMNTLNPPFIPGKQMGKAVRVLYTIPVTFKLEGRTRKKKRKKK